MLTYLLCSHELEENNSFAASLQQIGLNNKKWFKGKWQVCLNKNKNVKVLVGSESPLNGKQKGR